MKVQILAVGKMKAGPEQELYRRYAERFEQSGRNLGLSGPILNEIPESRHSSTVSRKDDEATQLLGLAADGATLFVLDEHGKDLASEELATVMDELQRAGTRNLAFCIGGPDGHGNSILSAAKRKIRLGKMTWPHQIARVLLVEQLYRANTIRLGHPYHRP